MRSSVTFCGMVSHSETLSRLRQSDVLVFPSLREFGGGVVFEALAMGVVPVVADYGGPSDIVTDEVGYRIPLTDEHEMAGQIQRVSRASRFLPEAPRKLAPTRCRICARTSHLGSESTNGYSKSDRGSRRRPEAQYVGTQNDPSR